MGGWSPFAQSWVIKKTQKDEGQTLSNDVQHKMDVIVHTSYCISWGIGEGRKKKSALDYCYWFFCFWNNRQHRKNKRSTQLERRWSPSCMSHYHVKKRYHAQLFSKRLTFFFCIFICDLLIVASKACHGELPMPSIASNLIKHILQQGLDWAWERANLI